MCYNFYCNNLANYTKTLIHFMLENIIRMTATYLISSNDSPQNIHVLPVEVTTDSKF